MTPRLMIIGEAYGVEEEIKRQPFIGPSGYELDTQLQSVGLDRRKIRMTNVVNARPPGNEIDLWFANKTEAKREHVVEIAGRYPRQPIRDGLQALQAEIDAYQPTLVIALGNTPLWALTGLTGIVKWRGSILEASGGPVDGHGVKLIPTLHPVFILREYQFRIAALTDLGRAKYESGFPEIRRPAWNFVIPSSPAEARDWFGEFVWSRPADAPIVADVENVIGPGSLICLGFAVDQLNAICIPFIHRELHEYGHYWNLNNELDLTRQCIDVLRKRPIIFHNGLHDVQIIASQWGITPYFAHDTMVGQHVLYPGMFGGKIDPVTGKSDKKGSSLSLAFCASLYCSYHRHWKDDGRSWDATINEEIDYFRYNCLAGFTPVLMEDCTWKRIEDIHAGEKILAFDEKVEGNRFARRLKSVYVTKIASTKKLTSEIILEDGRAIYGTLDHRVLAAKYNTGERGGKRQRLGTEWKTIGELRKDDELLDVGKPWESDNSFEGGWMAGFLDGEGTLGAQYYQRQYDNSAKRPYDYYAIRPSFSQKKGLVLDYAKTLLLRHNFVYTQATHTTTEYIDINGGIPEYLRFLGTFKTVRIKKRFLDGATQHGWSGFSALPTIKISKINPGKVLEVFDITTDAGTFIANGIIAHNCEDTVRTYEVFEAQQKRLAADGLQNAYFEKMSDFGPVFAMMFRGLNFDREARFRQSLSVARQKREIQAWIDHACNQLLNVDSNPQMCRFFYEDLQVPAVLNRKTRQPTTDSKTGLPTIAKRRPLLRPLVERIEALRSLNTFQENFLSVKLSKNDARLRAAFQVAGTESMRFTSNTNAFGEGINLQNIPRPPKD